VTDFIESGTRTALWPVVSWLRWRRNGGRPSATNTAAIRLRNQANRQEEARKRIAAQNRNGGD